MARRKTKRNPRNPWLVLRRSTIHGRGVYARKDIPEGTRLIEYTGERITNAEADRRYDDDHMGQHHTFLFILNRQNSTDTTVNANVRSATAPTPSQQPVIIQQQPTPLPQQPIIIQQPAPAADQPPVIIQQPAPTTTTNGTTAASKPSGTDDTAIQSEIDKRISQDATLSTADITPTVIEGKVTIIGAVESQAIKNQVERLVKGIKGVKAVDNQLIVSAPQ